MHGIRARDLPLIRAEIAAWLADPGPLGGPATWASGHEPRTAAEEWQAAGRWATALRAADLFYVSAGMSRTAVSAGVALPSYRLHEEDVPSRHGLLVWEEPVTPVHHGGEFTGAPLTAASWTTLGNRVHVRLWTSREYWITSMAEGDSKLGLRELSAAETRALRLRHPQPIVCMFSGFLPFRKTPGWLASTPSDTSSMSWAELEDRCRAASRHELAERALIASWLLIGQTIVREEELQISKAAAKQVSRIDPRLLTSVRYAYLRHRRSAPARPADGDRRRYDRYQWVVGGHWRDHWFPSRQATRPLWIDDHLKGPEGAPLLDPAKLVHVLRR
ncbi:hypothetical protein CTZ27_24900 [Streptomyces griseocarneus]|nr:hypothetical protein CTZ27_24900 [Streptomyces griseocarneus]